MSASQRNGTKRTLWDRPLEIIKTIFGGLIRGLPAVLLLLGMLIYVLGYRSAGDTRELCYSVAGAVLAGGVFSAFLKSLQFLGVFQREIEKMLADSGAKEAVAEIFQDAIATQEVWHSASVARLSKACPQLLEGLDESTLVDLLPVSLDKYYSNYVHQFKIRWLDREQGLFEVTQDITLDICPTRPGGEVTYSYQFQEGRLPGDLKTHEIESLKIDDQDYTGSTESTFEGDREYTRYQIPLRGKTQYQVQRRTVNQGSLEVEPYCEYTFSTYVKKVRLEVSCEDDGLEIEFKPMGNLVEFEDLFAPTATSMKKSCNGLLFPGQGYMLLFIVKGAVGRIGAEGTAE